LDRLGYWTHDWRHRRLFHDRDLAIGALIDICAVAPLDKEFFEARNLRNTLASTPNPKATLASADQKTGTGLARPRSLPQ
jgi:hypothetical protein